MESLLIRPVGDIVEKYPVGNPTITSTDKGAYYQLKSRSCVLRVYKKQLEFAMYDESDSKMIWAENKPLTYGDKTVQSLTRQPDEYFYGGGMQNGYFSHRGTTLLIEKGNGWDNGGRPNPSPFYMSTAGYGAFRNTFDVGKYAFEDTLKLGPTMRTGLIVFIFTGHR